MGQSGSGADREVTVGGPSPPFVALWDAVLNGAGCGPRDTGRSTEGEGADSLFTSPGS
jgi:hypothetical protein